MNESNGLELDPNSICAEGVYDTMLEGVNGTIKGQDTGVDFQHGDTCCVPGSERIIVPVIFTVIVFVGFIGNSLVLLVVLKNKDYFRNTTNLFIINLAFADLLFLLFCVPFHAVIYTTVNQWPFGLFMCKFVHLIQYSSMVASALTLVAMSLDRFLAIAYPLKTKHIRTPCTALVASLVIWTLSLAMAIPWLILYTVKQYTIGSSYETINVCADDWGKHKEDRQKYFMCLFMLGYVIPLITIFVLSALMIYQLWTIEEPECPSKGESIRTKRKVTRLVVVIVFVFCLCWLPSQVIWIWTNYFRKYWHYTYTFYYLRIFAHVLSYANSCMNPVIYAFLSENFRKGLRRALKCSTDNQVIPGASASQPLDSKVYSVSANEHKLIDKTTSSETCV